MHRQTRNQRDSAEVAQALSQHGLAHLKVVGRGVHLVVYSEEDGAKINRVRFTRIAEETYQLGFANHRGAWEMTPFEGSIAELLTLVLDQFTFTLIEL